MWIEHFRKLQDKCRHKLVYINWCMVLMSTLFNLLPLFINGDKQRRGYPSGQFENLLINTTYVAPVNSAVVRSVVTFQGIDVATDFHLAQVNQ